jgi:bacterial/archaeal transporter family-2 protein
MERLLAVIATVSVGALVAMQPPVNSELGKRTSVVAAAFIGTAIAAIALGLLALVLGEAGQVRRIPHIPVLYLTGGLMGAVLISVSLVTVRTLGAGAVVAATLSGQLFVSAILDRYGFLGLDRVGLTPTRLVGFALLFLGTALVTLR